MTNRPPDDPADCAACRPQIAALIDHELSALEQQQLEQHLASCPVCTVELNRQRMAQSALRGLTASLNAPADLRGRIDSKLEQSQLRGRIRRGLILLGGVAAALVILLAGGAALYRASHPLPDAPLLALAVGAHRQETNSAAPVTLSSSDAVAVEAWARPRADKHLDVPSLDSAGYRLVGARLEPAIGAGAVTLVYEGSGTRLTCTIVPISNPVLARFASTPSAPNHVATVDGTSIVSWRDGDAIYLLTADLGGDALLRLARLAAQSG